MSIFKGEVNARYEVKEKDFILVRIRTQSALAWIAD